ncbi:peptide/nickel transport system substrate-binding protein [Catenulispora sp. GP43]|uniref:ABC transporter substrate-binding protein n=1 Tax=Catenulispora sp. GP43 TaxID=3156263 RepID=UPI003519BBB4
MAGRNRAVAALTVTVLLVAGCGSGGTGRSGSQPDAARPTGPAAKAGGTLHVLAATTFEHLDPARNYVTDSEDVSRLIYRTLTTYAAAPGSAGGKIVPDLATDLGTPTDDAKTWTFHLKDGVEYEDGTPITAADVKYGVERSFADILPEGAPYARMWLVGGDKYQGPYKDKNGLASIEVPDTKTIVFHLNRPVADFGSTVSLPVFSPVPQAKDTGVDYDQHPVSSGPYKIDSYDPKAKLVLIRNTSWSATTDQVRKALPDRIEFELGLDTAVVDQRMIAAAGPDADAVALEPIGAASVAKVQNDPALKKRLVVSDSTSSRFLSLNTTHKPLNDVRVRQAVAFALDKDALRLTRGGPIAGDLATGLIPPSVAGHVPDDPYATPGGQGDPAKAKQLLTEAGFPGGIDLTLDLPGTATGKAQGEAIQESLGKAGIRVKLNEVPSSSYWSTEETVAQEHDMVIDGWTPDWTGPSTLLPIILDGRLITAQGNNNRAMYSSPEVDKRFDEIAAMGDVAAADQAYGELSKQIMADAPIVPFLWDKAAVLVGPHVAGAYGHVAYVGRLDLVSLGLS